MNNQLDYTWQQLMISAMILGTSTQPLNDRLIDVVTSRINRVFITHHTKTNVPEIDQALMDLENKLTDNGQLNFHDAINQMEEVKVKETIEQILELFSKVCRAYPE